MNRIKELRRKAGLSQKELGEAIGVNHSAIARYELGNRTVSVATARRLCDVFGCSMEYLFGQPEAAALEDAAVLEAYHALSAKDRKIVDTILREYWVC